MIAWVWGRAPTDLPERTRRRVILYLIPYLFFLYILAYLDRTNVSVAQLRMIKPPSEGGLGFTPYVCGFGAGIFFWGYWILEIPSAQSVLTYGARWVFVRILVLWGLACLLIGFIGLPTMNALLGWLPALGQLGLPDFLLGYLTDLPDDPVVSQFYFLRFMLGLFEGGFFPTVIFYLSIWFRARDRARAIATFMAAIPVSSMVGAPLSGLMLDLNWLGLPGWRWVFILQGAVPVAVGFLTLFFLPDRPEKAGWLRDDEKTWLTGELAREQQGKVGHGHGWGGQVWLVLLMTLYYFCMNVTSYGLSMFMPKILQSQSGFNDLNSTYLTALLFTFSLVGMLVNGWHSDKHQERIGHVAAPLVGLSLSLFAAALAVQQGGPWVAIVILIVGVGSCMYAHLPAFWPLPTVFMGAASAAAAIGFINMLGNLGGFFGPTLIGGLIGDAAKEGKYARGLFTLAPFPLVSMLIILFIGYMRRDKLAAARLPDPQPGVTDGRP
ncbi:MAG: MFS transporter [Gemmataceae bacterium]